MYDDDDEFVPVEFLQNYNAWVEKTHPYKKKSKLIPENENNKQSSNESEDHATQSQTQSISIQHLKLFYIICVFFLKKDI